MNDPVRVAKQEISMKATKLVSFDLVDTLVYRPTLSSEDMLRFFCFWVRSEYQIDIEADRLSAQKEMQNPYASLRDIWFYIARKRNKSANLAELLAEKEFEFDLRFLSARPIGKELYNYAVACGKKIIVVSDMYYSSEQIATILKKCNFTSTANIYVSCEYNAVKRSGKLFEHVLESEKMKTPSALLHIGDSQKADFLGPQLVGGRSVHIPDDLFLFLAPFGGKKLRHLFGSSVYESLIWGSAIHWLSENDEDRNASFRLNAFSHLTLFPMLLHVALFLLTQPDIQSREEYHYLDFVSRDGYLSKRAYDMLSVFFPAPVPSRYLMTSRTACARLMEHGFAERLKARDIPAHCTLRQWINVSVFNAQLKSRIFSELSDQALGLPVRKNMSECLRLLGNYAEDLEADRKELWQASMEYYSGVVGSAKRILMVDCGFEGTVSAYLTSGFQKKRFFDKVFFWEKPENMWLDRQIGTRTYTVFSEKKGRCLAPLVESFFSEPAGSCIGFYKTSDGVVRPLREAKWYPVKMKTDILGSQEMALTLVKRFAETFGEMLPMIGSSSMQSIMDVYSFFQTAVGCRFFEVFDQIRFKESYSPELETESLGAMMLRKCRKL